VDQLLDKASRNRAAIAFLVSDISRATIGEAHGALHRPLGGE
jgi:hypothetical protein